MEFLRLLKVLLLYQPILYPQLRKPTSTTIIMNLREFQEMWCKVFNPSTMEKALLILWIVITLNPNTSINMRKLMKLLCINPQEMTWELLPICIKLPPIIWTDWCHRKLEEELAMIMPENLYKIEKKEQQLDLPLYRQQLKRLKQRIQKLLVKLLPKLLLRLSPHHKSKLPKNFHVLLK